MVEVSVGMWQNNQSRGQKNWPMKELRKRPLGANMLQKWINRSSQVWYAVQSYNIITT